MWEWLSDPQNQKTLGFLGGGLAAVAVAVWAVVKFALSRPKPGTTTITADRGGMAAGRDINTAPPPSTTKRRR